MRGAVPPAVVKRYVYYTLYSSPTTTTTAGARRRSKRYKWSKSGQRPRNIPSTPQTVYRNGGSLGGGWSSWSDWLGYVGQCRASAGRNFLPFFEARAYVRALGLKGTREWDFWCRKSGKRPPNVPSNPHQVGGGYVRAVRSMRLCILVSNTVSLY